MPQDNLFSLNFLEPEKMPWRVTAIPSFWLVMTLTKPFSAVCALLALSPFPNRQGDFGDPHRCH